MSESISLFSQSQTWEEAAPGKTVVGPEKLLEGQCNSTLVGKVEGLELDQVGESGRHALKKEAYIKASKVQCEYDADRERRRQVLQVR